MQHLQYLIKLYFDVQVVLLHRPLKVRLQGAQLFEYGKDHQDGGEIVFGYALSRLRHYILEKEENID